MRAKQLFGNDPVWDQCLSNVQVLDELQVTKQIVFPESQA